jgi:hypothetical protein
MKIKIMLKKMYRQAKRLTLLTGYKLKFLINRQYFNHAHTVYFVDPEKIEWLTNFTSQEGHVEPRNRNFGMTFLNWGSTKPGNWDLPEYRFKELAVFKAIDARINKSECWENTEFFDECMHDINGGRVLWGCKNKDELLRRLKSIDNIISDIKSNGFKSGSESLLKEEDYSRLAKDRVLSDEITVNIGRDGQILFQDGRHRLAIALALKIPKVPIKVLVRHTLWRELLIRYKKQQLISINGEHFDVLYLFNGNNK